MKKIIYIIIFSFLTTQSFGRHITGGEIYYTFLGTSPTNASKLSYKITLLLYKDTTVVGQQVASLGVAYPISVYRGDNNQFVFTVTAERTKYEYMDLSNYNPCLNTKPAVRFAVATFEAFIELDALAEGYFVSHSQCCRINGINNINSNNVGASYWVKIPGSKDNPFAPNNSSAVFNKRDTILVCKSSPLQIDFSAIDPDNDVLVYKLTNGYIGASSGIPVPINSDPPPYNSVSYLGSYSAAIPLDPGVVIDPNTGIVRGIAPATTGVYLIAVLVEEYRGGTKISEHRKDFQIRVDDCTLTAAALQPTYITCNGTTLSFQNESTSSNITDYLWDFGIASLTTDTSSNPTPTYDYLKSGKDSGTYTVKLKVTAVGGCQDSAAALVKVYPGFTPNFTVTGTCFLNKYTFSDASFTKYGSINSWAWNFGDLTSLADTAHTNDSAWKYAAPSNTQITLLVTSTKGCIDSITKPVTILDKPILNLAFRDTLICSNDTLALNVTIGTGSVLWNPMDGPNKLRILNPTTISPLVYPRDTTRYYISVNDNGCANTDSVTVNVLQFISVKAGIDTGICKTDTIRLQPISDALTYQWTASTGEMVQSIKHPLVQPLLNTQYRVVANLGKCEAKDSFIVKVAPYPNAIASGDVTICYGSRVQLSGSIVGSNYFWSPTHSLINENTLSPVAGPDKTTQYILTATDTIGCPKISTDTILVTVIPYIKANAGIDTTVVPDQPVQMNASGGISYHWTPGIFLSDPTIANPIAMPDNTVDSILYTVRVSVGVCFNDDQILIRVFKNGPDIIVPSAYTPNGDGKNDVIKPILYGIANLNYFSIYSRWGELIFSTSQIGKGWDGNFMGTPQPAGAYVYQAEGIDYTGKSIFKKGTIVLIR